MKSPALKRGVYLLLSSAGKIKDGSCFLNTLLGANLVTRFTRLLIIFTKLERSVMYEQDHYSSKNR